VGASAYPRVIDFERIRTVADRIGAALFTDPGFSSSQFNSFSCATCHAVSADETAPRIGGSLYDTAYRVSWWGGYAPRLIDAVSFCTVYFMRGSPIDPEDPRGYSAYASDGFDRWCEIRDQSYAEHRDDADVRSDLPSEVSPYYNELSANGSWVTVPDYGRVWYPSGVYAGWRPYYDGYWAYGPGGYFWVSSEPWGWAPYHYGRWVHASGFWGWAPGPVVTRPVYAPALVVFLGGAVRVSLGLPLAWAPLGWGEPIIPWWGRPGQVGRASWDGWAGPRVVNNVVVNNTTIVNVQNITVYRT